MRIRTTIHNPTSTTFRARSISLLSPGIKGSIENMVSRFSTGTESPFEFSRGNPVPIFGVGPDDMTHLTLKKDNYSLSLVKTSPRSRIVPLDVGKMILGAGFFSFWTLEPDQTDEVSYFISLNSKEEFLEDLYQIFCNQ